MTKKISDRGPAQSHKRRGLAKKCPGCGGKYYKLGESGRCVPCELRKP